MSQLVSVQADAYPATADSLDQVRAELVSVTVKLPDGRLQEVPLGQGWAFLRFPDGELGVVSAGMAARFGVTG